MKGYIIATTTDECYGHGDFGTELSMRQEGIYDETRHFPPVFLKRESADKYLLDDDSSYTKSVVEIDIQET